jgi:serine protease Do
MNNNEWKPEDPNDLWEQSYYQTGSTRPPKSRQGFLAIALVAVIFIGGIISALGLLNIHLFRKNPNPDVEDASFRFSNETTAAQTDPVTTEATAQQAADADLQLQLNQSPQSVENIPQTGGLSLQSIYDKAIYSVVSISCSSPAGASTGTGVILSADGYIVTNCHVVENAAAVEVILHDGSKQPARIIGTDSVSDLAVLHADGSGFTPAEFGDSTALRVGDSVVAIGDPLGIALRGTMTDGIVSAINRDIATEGRTMTLIQTNAALNSGNSGGPLLNCYGQVVGINTMKIGDYMSSAGVEGLGFAIPSTTVKEIVDQLIANGYVSGRPSLGISGQEISAFEQMYYRLPQGIYITEVASSGGAATAGINAGDILLQFDGQRVTNTDELKSLLFTHNAGDTVSVVIYRSGQQYTLQVTLDEAQ